MWLGLALSLLGACDLPADPEGTSRRAANGTILVGVIESPPWASLAGGGAQGVEAELVQEFAKSMNARVGWISGSESRLMQALTQHQLDLVIGGIEAETAWRERVGLSIPYFRSATVVAAKPGTSAPSDLHGQQVAIAEGDPARERLRQLGGAAVAPGAGNTGLKAVESWQLSGQGLEPSAITLRTARHVIAVPPGENGWLLRLGRFLNAHRAELVARLQREGRS